MGDKGYVGKENESVRLGVVGTEEAVEGRAAIGCAPAERQTEEAGARDAADADRAVGELVPVQEDDANDLAETQRHDREIVAAQAQDRKAQQKPGKGRHGPGDRPADPEGQAEMSRQESG